MYVLWIEEWRLMSWCWAMVESMASWWYVFPLLCE
jgi:hypothetical protein